MHGLFAQVMPALPYALAALASRIVGTFVSLRQRFAMRGAMVFVEMPAVWRSPAAALFRWIRVIASFFDHRMEVRRRFIRRRRYRSGESAKY